MTSSKMKVSTFTLQQDRLFSIWNNAVHCTNLWVCAAGMYRATEILNRFHTAFFNYNYFSQMIIVPDKIVLARIMTALDLEFKRVCTTRMRDMTVIMTMDYQVHLWGLHAFTWFQWLRPPSTLGTTRVHKVLPLQAHQGNQWMSCPSAKQSADN